jgi:hypothetical protein
MKLVRDLVIFHVCGVPAWLGICGWLTYLTEGWT